MPQAAANSSPNRKAIYRDGSKHSQAIASHSRFNTRSSMIRSISVESQPPMTVSQPSSSRRLLLIVAGMFVFLSAVAFVVLRASFESDGPLSLGTLLSAQRYTRGNNGNDHFVYTSYTTLTPNIEMKLRRFRAMSSLLSEPHEYSAEAQLEYLTVYGDACHSTPQAVLDAYKEWAENPETSHLAMEIWKYCLLYNTGGVFVNLDSPLLSSVSDVLKQEHSYAVRNDPQFMRYNAGYHGAIISFRQTNSVVAQSMVERMVDIGVDAIWKNPEFLSIWLKELVEKDSTETWKILDLRCHVDSFTSTRFDIADSIEENESNSFMAVTEEARGLTMEQGLRISHFCPRQYGYCCDVVDSNGEAVLLTRYPVLPYQVLSSVKKLPKPYIFTVTTDRKFELTEELEKDLPYITTLTEVVTTKSLSTPLPPTPNFFEMLLENDCLPSDKYCSNCMRDKARGNCKTCKDVCSCYCKNLCRTKVQPKFVSKRVFVKIPVYAREYGRLIPRIVHQTWFEDVTKEKYPNMSRLVESWKRSGWKYNFYSDEAAQEFLSIHFPPEVKEAFDAINPGAFKADLFRYCALFIYGGVYADMDVLLETNLDAAVSGDVGFMTPVDEPGATTGHRMCLWNGLIAAAPGHPYLARAIETVVNNIRNRFTSVDTDNTLCPDPELSVSHSFDTLFTAGPCILGASLNRVLRRHPQTQFEAGDIDPFAKEKEAARKRGEGFAPVSGSDDARVHIPGRTIILNQDKWDMGAHRFTWLEKNMVVAATDMPDYDDRQNLDGNVHYSKVHVKQGIYGLDKLYTDRNIANEEIRIVVSQ